MDEYYRESTSRILDSVTSELSKDSNKKFHWSDIAFFHMWWENQSKQKKEDVKILVNENRLIFIGGGWVINDEALPSYKEMMLQMRLGLEFLRNTFNVRPTIGWQIDPFGSSASTVAVLYKLGYEGLVENRISANFKHTNRFNFVWEGHQVSANKSEVSLFTHILQRHYNIPDIWSDSQFLSKSIESLKYNTWSQEVDPPVKEIKDLSQNSSTKYNVMITAGDDFSYVNAGSIYGHYSDLAKALEDLGNKTHGFDTTAKFSNLYEYFRSIHDMGLTYPKFYGDFLPFHEPMSGWEDFWTGYYSSRLHLKRQIRHVFNDLQSTKTLLAIRAKAANSGHVNFTTDTAKQLDDMNKFILVAEQKWSVLMHHDAITGTHPPHTMPSYYQMLDEALQNLQKARNLMDTHFPISLSSSFTAELRKIYDKMINPEIIHHTIVNPAGYYRIQILNITVNGDSSDGFVVCLANANSLN